MGTRANILKLSDYTSLHDCKPHHYYEYFWGDIPGLPDISTPGISQCCHTRPMVFLENGKKRLVIHGFFCYVHGRVAVDRGYSDTKIWIQEVKNMSDRDVFCGIFLDSLCACPIQKIKPLFRIQILKRAFEKKDFLQDFFDVSSFAAFSRIFDVAPSMLTRDKKLEPQERTRLALGRYKKRGTSLKKKSDKIKQCNDIPQSSESPFKKNEQKTDVKKQQDLF